jgi:hypothetical protein
MTAKVISNGTIATWRVRFEELPPPRSARMSSCSIRSTIKSTIATTPTEAVICEYDACSSA